MRVTTSETHHHLVRKVLRLIRDRAAGDRANLTCMAQLARLSPFHFHRVFKQLTTMTPDEHLRGLRLVRAAVALRTGRQPIVRVAIDAGYKNHESFSRAFRQYFGTAPVAYRRQHLRSKEKQMKDMKPAVQLIKVPVTDFGRAQVFYRDVLGLEEEFAVAAYGWGQYKVGDLPLCIYVVGMGGGDGKPGGETNFHLAVDDAKQAYAQLKSKGASLPCALTSSDDGGSFFMVADPDGNAFKIVQRV